jgi:hypothetical protein
VDLRIKKEKKCLYRTMTNCTLACRVDHNNDNETESSSVCNRVDFIRDKVATVVKTYVVDRLEYVKCMPSFRDDCVASV